MNSRKKVFSACVLALLTQAAFAQSAPDLGTASNFAVLSEAPYGGGAVTCTDSTIDGNVGSSGLRAAVVQTRCTISGAIVAPVSAGVVDDFYDAYAALAPQTGDECPVITGTLAGQTLAPGVYCVSDEAKTGVLTLDGSSNANGIWIFKIVPVPQTPTPTGALTGTNFSVVMAGGGDACNVTWWVPEAVTMTTSGFQGTILAGAAITMTGIAGSTTAYNGNALAKAAVTLTDVTVTGCGTGAVTPLKHCNQGVGNGPEFCDPGNSNQGNPFRSNDELGGTPGNPGRKGGNTK
jgi:hypothetical protein